MLGARRALEQLDRYSVIQLYNRTPDLSMTEPATGEPRVSHK